METKDWQFPKENRSWEFPRFRAEERILVLGVGGSLDIVSAFAVASVLVSLSPDATVLYGGADLYADVTGWNHVAGCLYKRPSPKKTSTRIEWLLPQGPEGSPLMFRLPQLPHSSTADALTKANLASFECLVSLALDSVVFVDVGGDVLTGGARADPRLGQDWQVLNAALSVLLKVPSLLLVVGVGADGESSASQLSAVFSQAHKAHALLGYRPLTLPVTMPASSKSSNSSSASSSSSSDCSTGGSESESKGGGANGSVQSGSDSGSGKSGSGSDSGNGVVGVVGVVATPAPTTASFVVQDNPAVEEDNDNNNNDNDTNNNNNHDKEVSIIVDQLRNVRSVYRVRDNAACPNIIVTAIDQRSQTHNNKNSKHSGNSNSSSSNNNTSGASEQKTHSKRSDKNKKTSANSGSSGNSKSEGVQVMTVPRHSRPVLPLDWLASLVAVDPRWVVNRAAVHAASAKK